MKWYKSIIGAMAVILIIIISSIGIYVFTNSGGIYSDREVENHRKIGASYMTMNNPYFAVINEEIKYIVEGNGDILITRDPALDIDKQIQEIYDFIDLDVKAIFINAVDWIAIRPALEAAREAGIIVIVIDADVLDEELVNCTIVSDNYEAGVLCAKDLMSRITGGNIILLEHSRVKSAIDRIKGFEDTIATNYNIIKRIECDGQLEISMPIVEEILSETKEIDAVMALNDPSALGAIIALEKNEMNDVLVYGVDGSPDGKSMIKEERMMATVAQFPRQTGRTAGEVLYDIFEGVEIEKKIIIPVELINVSNVDEYEINILQ